MQTVMRLFKLYHPGSLPISGGSVAGPGNSPAALIALAVILLLVLVGLYFLIQKLRPKF